MHTETLQKIDYISPQSNSQQMLKGYNHVEHTVCLTKIKLKMNKKRL